jgi:hypothetical protein
MKLLAVIIAVMLLTSGCLMYPLSQPSSMQVYAAVNGVPVAPLTGVAAWWSNICAHPYVAITEAVTEGTAIYVAADAAWNKLKPSKDAAPTTAATGGASGATTYTFNGPTTFYQKGMK